MTRDRSEPMSKAIPQSKWTFPVFWVMISFLPHFLPHSTQASSKKCEWPSNLAQLGEERSQQTQGISEAALSFVAYLKGKWPGSTE